MSVSAFLESKGLKILDSYEADEVSDEGCDLEDGWYVQVAEYEERPYILHRVEGEYHVTKGLFSTKEELFDEIDKNTSLSMRH